MDATNAAAPSAVVGGNQGFGGVLGLQLKRDMRIRRLYARGRYALTSGNDRASANLPFTIHDGIRHRIAQVESSWGPPILVGDGWPSFSCSLRTDLDSGPACRLAS
jgi:hypothetical protein